MKKRIKVFVMAVIMTLGATFVAEAAYGYVQDGDGWVYYDRDGAVERCSADTGWVDDEGQCCFKDTYGYLFAESASINGKLYIFDGDCHIITGWFDMDYGSLNPATGEFYIPKTGYRYYFHPDGSGAVGWTQIDGNWYYFGNDSIMLKSTETPDGYYVGSDGIWTEAAQEEWEDWQEEKEELAEKRQEEEFKIGAEEFEEEVEEARNMSEEEMLERLVELINEEREKHGLEPLEVSDTLMDLAETRAEEVTEKFSHERPDGAGPSLKDLKLRENIATTNNTPGSAFRGWMNSKGHRENILNPSAKHIGVGRCQSKRGSSFACWVMLISLK